jgi:predicted polyphosphate/ATP-dependent NAD kinase
MGEDAARACGFQPTVLGLITPGETAPGDTRNAALEMRREGVDLLLFAGGDGTARDIYEAIGDALPVLGIPAGVKIHSAVYATSPVSAGELAALYLRGRVASLREAEVMDIDEEAFRRGSLAARLYGYLQVPFRSSLVQNLKVASVGGEAAVGPIAADVVERMEEGCLYIIGPGTTTRAITDELGLRKTLLGVDVVVVDEQPAAGGDRVARLVAADLNETQILQLLEQSDRGAKVIITLIGGQGYILGRGNQQISPSVIEEVGPDNIIVVATKEKLYALGRQPLRVDTGDTAVDQMLSGYLTVVTGYRESAVRKVVC